MGWLWGLQKGKGGETWSFSRFLRPETDFLHKTEKVKTQRLNCLYVQSEIPLLIVVRCKLTTEFSTQLPFELKLCIPVESVRGL